MISSQDKAEVLVEALPWLQRLRGKIVVVKFGGNAMINQSLKSAFAQDIVFLAMCGVKVVVSHGGGPQISTALESAGIASQFKGGLRVTTPEIMTVVRNVLVNEVRSELVDLITSHGAQAVGLSGEDEKLFVAEKRGVVIDGEEVDIGLVGDVVEVNASIVKSTLERGHIPVVTSVAFDSHGQLHNVNADTAAAALATALHAEKLILLTDVQGLFRDWPTSTEIISSIASAELSQLLPTLSDGMIPKMEACLRAVNSGVSKAHVIDGRVAHSLLLELATDQGIGTEVVA